MKILLEIRNRKSHLFFKEKEIEKDKFAALVEAARWAPSCYNKQPWKYIFIHKDCDNRQEVENALSLGNSWAKKAPYLVIVCANKEDDCEANGFSYYAYDTGMSVMSLSLEAEHQGLAVHQMAGFDSDKIKKAAALPEGYVPIVTFALGYPDNPKKIKDKLGKKIREKLVRQRSRKPAEENFFSGTFGNIYK